MVFDDETELDTNVEATSKDSTKTEPQLEKYGVWIKKGPENLESPQEIPETFDISEDISFDTPKQEQIDSIDEEFDSLMDSSESVEPAKEDIIEDNSSIISDGVPDFGLPEGLDIPGVDLSAFENNDIPAPKSEPEGEVSIDMDDFFSSDSGDGEVDLSSFFGDGESIDFDDFMSDSGTKKEPEIIDEEPLDINLEFDDNFVLETKADPVSQVEFVGFDGESGEMSFDDLFDNIQDEGAAFPSDFADSTTEIPQIPEVDISSFETEDFTSQFMSETSSEPVVAKEETKTESAYDDASEFDDLLSSLDEATPLTDTPEEAKTKKLFQDYDITVTMDEEDLSEETEEDENQTDDDLDDISLFQSNEDIENFKQQAKNNGQPVGGMKVLEAQSSMDFDEIDKILAEGDFDFPSDNVSEENSVEDSQEEVTVTEEAPENVSFDVDSLDETNLQDEITDEMSLVDETPTLVIEDTNIELDDNITLEEPEIAMEDDISEPDDNITLEEPEIAIEEEISETDDNITLEEPEIAMEEEISEPEDDITLEEPEIVMEEEIAEPQFDLDEEPTQTEIIAEEDDVLDDSFSEIEETTEEITDEPQDIIQNSDDELLDMDFSDEETIIEEEKQEETIENQGDTIMEENDNLVENTQETNNVVADNASTAILEKIAAEITNLRSEITNLRTEFNSLKTGSTNDEILDEPEQETPIESENQEETSGFFNDDNEDETISLSGDELNNILNNANFTTEEPTEDNISASDETDEIDNSDELLDSNEETEEESEAIEEPVVDDVAEIQDETVVNPLGDATELTDSDLDTIDEYEEDSFAEESETSDFADEDLQEPELDELKMDNDFDENDEDLQEEIDIPKEENAVETEEEYEDESFEEPETNDFIESINAVDPTISETLTEDRLKYLEDTFEDEPEVTEEVEETPEEPVQEETEEVSEEDTVSEPEETIEEDDELEESNEPTEDVFNSPQWDNEVPSVENVLAENDTIEDVATKESDTICEEEIIEPETDEDNIVQDNIEEQNLSAEEEVTQVVEKPVATNTTSPTSKIQDDIKSVLVYMDQLLENLPEEKIEEFAKSEHFDTYKKLFSELGISN